MQKVDKKVLTRAFSNSDLVTLAVYLEGGDRRSVDTEDAAVRAHRLAPGRFSWRKYPEQINLELIRVYLSDAKKADKGAYLSGSGRTGWKLTSAGLDWVQRSKHIALKTNHVRRREDLRGGSVDEQRWRGERARIQHTEAWKKWQEGAALSQRDASDVFRIDSYARGDLRETKITRLISMFLEDENVSAFLKAASKVLKLGEKQK